MKDRTIKRLAAGIVFVACSLVATAQTKTVTHEIQRGETIESIAKNYGVTVESIKQANPNAGDYFFVGMKIQVPVIEVANTSVPAAISILDDTVTATYILKQTEVKDNYIGNTGTQENKRRKRNNGYPTRSYLNLHYMQGFEEGATGSYGLGGNFMNINSSYFGASFLINTNLGIVDIHSVSSNFLLGPNFNYMLSNRWSVFVPLYVSLMWQSIPKTEIRESDGYFMGDYVGKSTWEVETSETDFNWGLMASPSIAFYYKKIAIALGFVLSWGKGADKLGTGFIVNLGCEL